MTVEYYNRQAVMHESQNFIEFLSKLSPDNFRIICDLTQKLLDLQSFETPDFSLQSLSEFDYFKEIPGWLNHLLVQRRSPLTIRVYRYYVEELLRSIPQPTPILIEAHLALKTGTGIAAQAIANRIYALRSFFSYLDDHNIIQYDPTLKVKTPRIPRRERYIPKSQHIVELLNSSVVSVRDRMIFLLLVGCGLRLSEATNLRVSDVDLVPPHGRVTVIGKGNKQRTVSIPLYIVEALSIYISNLPVGSVWLFPSRKSHVTSKHIERSLKQYFQHIDIPSFTPHQLRHYFSSALLNSGASLKVVSQILGHSGPDVTARVYWHLIDAEAQHEAIYQHNPLSAIQLDLNQEDANAS